VVHSAVPADTSAEVFALQVEAWRRLSIVERVEIVRKLNANVERLAVAGIRMVDPDIDDDALRHELTRRRYGSELADAAYGVRRP